MKFHESTRKLRLNGFVAGGVVVWRHVNQRYTEQRLRVELPAVFLLLATLLTVGVGIEDAIAYTLQSCQGRSAKRYLNAAFTGVRDGHALSSIYEGVLPAWLTVLVRTAEQTGELPRVLSDWSQQTQAERRFLKEIGKKLAYPAVLLVTTCLALAVIGILVLPQFEQMYAELGLKIPVFVQLMTAVWRHIFVIPTTLSLVGVCLFVGGTVLKRSQPAAWYWVCRKLPGYRMVRLHRTYRLSFTLAQLTRAGVPLMEAALALAQSGTQKWFVDANNTVATRVAAGMELSGVFADDWDPILTLQVQFAEVSGDLANALERTQQLTRQMFVHRMEQRIEWLEPALSVALGGTIGVTMFSLYVPMYSLISSIHLS